MRVCRTASDRENGQHEFFFRAHPGGGCCRNRAALILLCWTIRDAIAKIINRQSISKCNIDEREP